MKVFRNIALAAVSFIVSTFRPPGLGAMSGPVREKISIAEILPRVGAPSGRLPESFLLEEGGLVVAIGDSITASGGYLRYADSALAEIYPGLELPRIVNAGISGQKAENLVKRFRRDVLARGPDVVAINIGVNDVGHRLGAPHDEAVIEAYRENLARMVDMARSEGIEVILLTPTIIGENPAFEGNRRLARYAEAMRSVAREKQCFLVDLHAMFLAVLEANPDEARGNRLTTDGVHMRPVGDAVIAVGLLRGLGVPEKTLEQLK